MLAANPARSLRLSLGLLALGASLVAACSQGVIEATSGSASGSTGSDTTTGTTGTGGASSGATTGAGTTAGATTGAGGAGGSTTASTGTGMLPGMCGNVACTAKQLCVRPACRDVMGEECYLTAPDGGQACPPGTDRSIQFDPDCPPNGFACVGGCPPEPPFCVDLPAGCGGVASCGCLAMDPCSPSNSGACHDADIAAGVLSCSLEP